MEPFPYQQEALEILQGTRDSRKTEALVVLASGLGKTALAAFDAKAYLSDGGRLLYLCDQNHILGQARKTFRTVLGNKFSFASLHGGSMDLDSMHKAKCVFSSFQTMREWQEVFAPGSFDYIVVDEGHHIHASTYRSTLSYFRHDFLLGLTATPDRADLQDIRSIFGEEVYSLPLEKALALGHLTPVRYVLLSPRAEGFEELLEDAAYLSVKDLDQRLFNKQTDDEVATTIRQYTAGIADPRTMVFCPSIEDCDQFTSFLPDSSPIHSKLTRGEQDRRLDRFRVGSLPTVLTVDKFNEGLDVPEANLIVFRRSTGSRTIFLQQLGRGLRRAQGKDEVVVLDFVGNCQRLEMVHDMWQSVANIRSTLIDGETPDTAVSCFNVFSESTEEIIEIIRKVRSRPKQKRQRWSVPDIPPEELEQKLRELGPKIDRLPAKTILRRHGLPSARVFAEVFGSWEAALEAAGYCPKGKKYPDDVMEQQLYQLKETLGHKLTVTDLIDAVRRGQIANDLIYPFNVRRLARAQGINRQELFEDETPKTIVPGERKPNQRTGHPYTREELIGQMVNVIDFLGKRPTGMDDLFAAREGGLVVATYQTFRNHFGSFRNAVDAAYQRSDEEDKNA